MDLPLRIFEVEPTKTRSRGTLRDISEKGFRVIGIESGVGETKSFVIVAHELFQTVYPLVFEAQCRWVKREGANREWVAGYEITRISDPSLEELRRVVKIIGTMWEF
jgi:hypothetical protein